jgi:ABC-2 type transport system permease protein
MTTALRAEWRKLRFLPLPRRLLLGFLLASAGGAAIALAAPAGTPATVAENAQIGLLTAGTVAAVVFAVWTIGIEGTQGTLARTFVAEPRRGVVLAAKAIVAMLLPAAATALAVAITLPLAVAAVNAHGGHADVAELARQFGASAAQVVLVAPIAFGLAVLTRSMAGGIAASLGLLMLLPGVFAVSGLAAASPTIALQSLHDRIAGSTTGFGLTAHENIALATILLVIAAWPVGLMAAGAIRVTARDVH